jgi:hypothetical protein
MNSEAMKHAGFTIWLASVSLLITAPIDCRLIDLPPRTVPLFMLGLAYHFP